VVISFQVFSEGIDSGGLIRILAKNTDKIPRINIFNNAATLASDNDPSHYLS
jgi:hypothetical protein